MSNRRLLPVLFCLVVAGAASCEQRDPRFCDEDTPCTRVEFPYCDLNGEISGTSNQCIPMPSFDASVPPMDAPATLDASLVDGPVADALQDARVVDAIPPADAAPAGPGLGELCSLSGSGPDGSCPSGAECLSFPNNPEDTGWCSPSCESGGDESCQLTYGALSECLTFDIIDGCILHCNQLDPCPSGFLCADTTDINNDGVMENDVCVPFVNGLGTACSSGCPAGNKCVDTDGDGDGGCGPPCIEDSECSTGYDGSGTAVCHNTNTCAISCDADIDCPAALPQCDTGAGVCQDP